MATFIAGLIVGMFAMMTVLCVIGVIGDGEEDDDG